MGRARPLVALAGLLIGVATGTVRGQEDEPTGAPRITRTVTVVRKEDQVPIEGATVELRHGDVGPRVLTTGKSGTVEFPYPVTKDVVIAARAPGRVLGVWTSWDLHRHGDAWAAEKAQEAPKPLDSVTIELGKGRVLEGRVISAVDGTPIPGATVEAWESTRRWTPLHAQVPCWTAVSDATGAYRTDQGIEEAHEVSVTAPGWASDAFTFAGRHSTTPPTTLDLPVQPAGEIRGVVAGVGEGTVTIDADPPQGLHLPGLRPLTAEANSDGTYRIEGALVGIPYSVHASDPERRSLVTEDVRVARQGKEVACDLALIPLGGVLVRVSRETGLKLFLAIDLEVPTRDSRFRKARDTERGMLFPGVFPGRYTLRVDARGWLPLVREVEVVAGEVLELDVDLLPGVALEGTVVDEKGEAVADLRMHAGIPNPADPANALDEEEAFSDEEGNFRFEGLAEGPVVIRLDRGVQTCVLAEVVKAQAPGKGLWIVVRRK